MVQEKRYGVDSRLLDELKICQFNRRRRSNMFEQSALVSINNVGENELMVRATHKRLTTVSTVIQNFRPPVQVIDQIDETTVEIVIDISQFARIRFRSAADLSAFRRALGDLAENDSSGTNEESDVSVSTEGSQTSISSTKEYRSIGRGHTQAYGRGKLKR
jgi:hypothetical protein